MANLNQVDRMLSDHPSGMYVRAWSKGVLRMRITMLLLIFAGVAFSAKAAAMEPALHWNLKRVIKTPKNLKQDLEEIHTNTLQEEESEIDQFAIDDLEDESKDNARIILVDAYEYILLYAYNHREKFSKLKNLHNFLSKKQIQRIKKFSKRIKEDPWMEFPDVVDAIGEFAESMAAKKVRKAYVAFVKELKKQKVAADFKARHQNLVN
jgi:hypothetical protein